MIVNILSNNFSGETTNITFSPSTGGTQVISGVVIPYEFSTQWGYGDYSIVIPTYSKTCPMSVPEPTFTASILPTGTTQYENVILTGSTDLNSPVYNWSLTDFFDVSGNSVSSYVGNPLIEGYFSSTGGSVSMTAVGEDDYGNTFSATTSGITISAFDPLSTSPDWWYDMSDSSTMTFRTGTDYVEQVEDKSGNGRHLTQSTAAYQPLYSGSAINPSLSALTFNGIDERMDYIGSSIRSISGQTYLGIGQNKSKQTMPGQPGGAGLGGCFFMFYDPTSSSNSRYMYREDTNWLMNYYYQNQKKAVISTVDGGNDKIIYYRRENSTTYDDSIVNGVSLTTTGTAQARTYDGGSVYFGWFILTPDYQTKLYGEHSELFHFHRTITDEEKDQLNRYLQYKWFGSMTY